MFISIQNRIIFLLITFTLLPFVILKITAFPKVESDVEKMQILHLDSVGSKQAMLVSNWIRERMKDVLVLSDNPYMVNSVNLTMNDKEYGETLRYLELVVVEYGYMGAFVCNDKGLVTIATINENVGRDLLEKDFFKHSIQGQTFASSIVPSEVPLVNELDEREIGVPTMFVTTPLKNKDNDIVGVVALRVHMGKLSNMVYSLMFGKTGESYLVNEKGYMISESRFSDRLKEKGIVEKRCSLELKVTDPETGELTHGVAQCISGKNGFDGIGYTGYNGITVLGAWHWLPEFKWGVITEIDRDEGYGLAYNLHFIVNTILFAIAFPVVLAAYLTGRRLSNPILRLRSITDKMASGGDLSQRIDIKQKDEIGGLADAFNSMVSSLEAKTRELEASEKRYKRRIQSSEGLHRALLNSISDGVYQCSPYLDGVFTYINQSGAEILGYSSPEEVVGTRVVDIYVNSEDRKELIGSLDKQGVCKDYTAFCKKKNGERFIFEVSCSLVRDETGKPIMIEGIFRDMTDQ